MTATVVSAGAVLVTSAILAIGHDARFTEVVEAVEQPRKAVNDALQEALGAGLVVQLGTPRSPSARWAATANGTKAVEAMATELEREPEFEVSSREAILAVVRQEGVVATGRVLRRLLATRSPSHRTLGQHSLNHQLHSMVRLGLLEAQVQRHGSDQEITQIRLSDAARSAGPGSRATIAAEVPEPTDPAAEWPELEALRVRVAAGEDARRLAAALVDAAELLAKLDPLESERLFDRAAAVAVPDLTAAEDEYLRFAALKGDGS